MKIARVFSLVLVLSGFAFANSIDYDTGAFLSGTFAGTFTTSISFTDVGKSNTFMVSTGSLTLAASCTPGSTCYTFSSGSLAIVHDGVTIFSDSLSGGMTIKNGSIVALSATLTPAAGVAAGALVATFDFSGSKLVTGSGNATVMPAITPEPEAAALMGTGLACLVWSIGWRRRLRGKL
jgi:hypothetical protein